MFENVVDANRIISAPNRRGEATTGGGYRSKAEMLQQACAPDIPWIGNRKARLFVECPKLRPFLSNGRHSNSPLKFVVSLRCDASAVPLDPIRFVSVPHPTDSRKVLHRSG